MIKTVLKWLFLLVATFYIIDAGAKLMTYPNDGTFIVGILMLTLTGLFWVMKMYDGVYYVVGKFIKEKNEKS